ncbi:S8 family serine peptidase [Bacillus sp. AFS017336]|uniref:S8 family serine peptidase n=1 Tax=Bacillus sp. AFS017336 TaxID=2033489 RepID=UPI000BEFAD3F|nr:S8 family serine peptidase [Bacillus sp. AFS017336]PEL14021.1 peptidase S8 [Bacillus sp. AFS017336]
MKMSKMKHVLTGTLVTSLLFSANGQFKAIAETKSQNTQNSVEKMLSSLTDEERMALNQLDVSPGFVISPDINQRSSELVNVIVEFNQAPAKVEVLKQAMKGKKLTLSSAKTKQDSDHTTFKKEWGKVKSLNERKLAEMKDAKITREYHDAFNGVAMTLPGTAVQQLMSTGVVKRVWPDKSVALDLPKEADELKTSTPTKVDDSLPQIGADKLHEENITGKGVKVGVIDTGIDYNHPDLKGIYKGGYDFIDNDSDPMETTYKDWKASGQAETDSNGSTYYTEHGTHVSGSIGAQKKNDSPSAVMGVAPDVDLYVYRVLGPYGSGSNDAVMAGIDRAVKDGMDVINLSLGSSENDPLEPTSIAINNAMLSGTVAVVAAGNAGPDEKTLGSPGAAALAVTVGASDVSLTIPTMTASAGDQKFPNMQLIAENYTDKLEDLQNTTLPLVDVGLGTKADYTNKDVTGKVALIQRGTYTFDEKIQNAKAAGAKAVIIYNNVDGNIDAYLGEGTNYVPSFRISKADGERLKGQKDITFESTGSIKTEGDHLADFSSRGPAAGNDDIKPDVVGPGVAIFSTLPIYMNNKNDDTNYDMAYGRLSGTSMATPHVTGSAALILQAHPDYTPFEVKEALMNTADKMNGDNSVNAVGAGRINVYEAVHADTLLKVMDKTKNVQDGNLVDIDEETGSIAYGTHYLEDDKKVQDSRKVVIENHNKQDQKKFDIRVELLPAMGEIQDGVKNGVTVDVPSPISVDAGKSTEINPTISVPKTAHIGRYEGYIYFVNSKNKDENYQIPFSINVRNGKGFDYMNISRPMMSDNPENIHPFSTLYVNGYFKLSSPATTIDILVKDGKTGEPIGLVGTSGASNLLTGTDYFLERIFTGVVYPFTDDKKRPISDQKVRLPEGDYIVEMISHDENGKTYSMEDKVTIDNTPPKVEVDMKPGIYEVNDSMYTTEPGYNGPAIWIHGNVFDAGVDALRKKGLNVDQSINGALYYEYSVYNNSLLAIDSDGNFRFPVTKIGVDQIGYVDSNLFVFDNGTAAESYPKGIKNYKFIKEGTEYGVPTYNKENVRLGDEITMTLNLNNIKQLAFGEFTVPFANNYFSFQSAKINDAFKKYAEEKGAKVNLTSPVLSTGSVKVGASIDQGDLKIDKNLPFIDVTLKLTNDKLFAQEGYAFDVSSFKYKKTADATTTNLIRVYKDKPFYVLSKQSTVSGVMWPEAFMKNGQIDSKVDYSKLGAIVYAQDANGKIYNVTSISKSSYFTIDNLPFSNKDYDIYVKIPGHFATKVSSKLVRDFNGDLAGSSKVVEMEKNHAGDVNGDNVIDVMDAIYLQVYWGTNKRAADINNDGIVDEKDFAFVEKNYLMQNTEIDSTVKPKKTYKKQTLESVKKDLGIN